MLEDVATYSNLLQLLLTSFNLEFGSRRVSPNALQSCPFFTPLFNLSPQKVPACRQTGQEGLAPIFPLFFSILSPLNNSRSR